MFSTVALLINASVIFNLSFAALHIAAASHEHSETKGCTQEKENDACHRFTVHHEKSEACNGTHQHVTIKTEECFVCKYSKESSLYFQIPDNFSVRVQYAPACVFNYNAEFSSSLANEIFPRGPPALS